jgi:hypothetical protein
MESQGPFVFLDAWVRAKPHGICLRAMPGCLLLAAACLRLPIRRCLGRNTIVVQGGQYQAHLRAAAAGKGEQVLGLRLVVLCTQGQGGKVLHLPDQVAPGVLGILLLGRIRASRRCRPSERASGLEPHSSNLPSFRQSSLMEASLAAFFSQ